MNMCNNNEIDYSSVILREIRRSGLERWSCSICGWKSIVPSKNRILLHAKSKCAYKPMGHHSCLTPYIRSMKKIRKKLLRHRLSSFER